jgi:hypothetical protein
MLPKALGLEPTPLDSRFWRKPLRKDCNAAVPAPLVAAAPLLAGVLASAVLDAVLPLDAALPPKSEISFENDEFNVEIVWEDSVDDPPSAALELLTSSLLPTSVMSDCNERMMPD